MEKLVIEGGRPLRGRVQVAGAKNAALPILASCLLSEEPCRVEGVPDLRDVDVMLELLELLGVQARRTGDGAVETKVVDPSLVMAPYEIVRKMRASVCLLGPLLGRRGTAIVSMPGGCVIGTRPIDLHLRGLRALGTLIGVEGGYVHATSESLAGNRIDMGGTRGSTVLGTANVLMAAVRARGTTIIDNAAREPEVVNLIDTLNIRGARIKGGGTSQLVIEGVERIGGGTLRIIPDRIEAATYLVAGAITRGDVTVAGAGVRDLRPVLAVLQRMGVDIQVSGAGMGSAMTLADVLGELDHEEKKGLRSAAIPELTDLRVQLTGRAQATDFATEPHPGFPTDAQAQIMALMAISQGSSRIVEGIYPDRFMHVAELARLGARIDRDGDRAVVHGVDRLSGAPVMASDLRASAALVLAGLVAEGTTEVLRIYHIDRGYERIEQRLRALGASVRREVEATPGGGSSEGLAEAA